MTARIIDGVAIGQDIRTEIAAEVTRLTARGIVPGLAVVLVGEDPASQVYVKMKGRRCEEAGMRSTTIRLPDDTSEAELLATIDRLNGDPVGLLTLSALGDDERRVEIDVVEVGDGEIYVAGTSERK